MQDKQQIKEYAIKIYNSPSGEGTRPDLARCLGRIKRLCTRPLDMGGGGAWLSDNFYLVRREVKTLMKLKKAALPTRSRLYSYIEKLLFFTEYEVNCDVVSCFFEVFSHGDFLSDRELMCTKNVMKALIVARMARLCDELEQCRGTDMPSVERSAACERLAANLVTSLRTADSVDFASFVMGYSPIERLFRRDPSGIYPNMDKQTQAMYREELEKYSRKTHMPCTEILEEILARCSEAQGEARHVGFYLHKQPRGYAYFVSIICTFCVLCTIFYAFLGFWTVFCAISLWESAKILCDRALSRIKIPKPLPKMRFDSPSAVPDDCRTLTVVTTLLFGGEADSELFSRLERFYLANRGKNLLFGALCDLREADSATKEGDEEIIKGAVNAIEKLNSRYGGGFYLFLRPRVYSETQRKYMGYERKRGAVIQLSRLLRGNSDGFSHIIGDTSQLSGVRYVVTLDGDTDVGMGQITRLCAAMAHPLNKPVISHNKDGFYVSRGHAILQPAIGNSLYSSGKTPFSVLKSGAGGRDIYASAAYDSYQAFFARANFCGKGIFDVDAFLKVIDNAFPEERVLSHDILEGCLLRCALVGDVTFTDGMPPDTSSYFKREHRWTRGDVQALPFSTRSTLSPLSKYKLWDNLLRALLPINAVILCTLSAVTGRKALFFAGLLYLFAPFVWDAAVLTATAGFHCIFRRFTSHVMSGIWSGFVNLVYDMCTLFHRAYVNADAILRSLWRMATSRRLMDWTTALETSGKSGFFEYVWYMKYSVIAGMLFAFVTGAGGTRLLGVLFILSPAVCFALSLPLKDTVRPDSEQCKKITRYCRDMWGFFEKYTDEATHHLPPDNVQFSPVSVTALRTSPTNIGLYMLSALAARDFGFITTHQLYERLRGTLETLDKLEKWQGHLYNWYDISTLSVIGTRYVSTVDSGNFVTCLVALVQGLHEYAYEDGRLNMICERCTRIIDKTDFRPLYNTARDLFYIGYNAQNDNFGENCYDLHMSEARSGGFFAVARGDVPLRHWSVPSRALISHGGYIGAASWSGTAFEYFMPALLLPTHKNSFAREALEYAYRRQKSHTAQAQGISVWGTSECGYYDFDAELNYCYKAIGVPQLSLRREREKEKVISPYSSFLMLAFHPNSVLKNLESLEKLGMYSKYGFYESADFTEGRSEGEYAIVQSHMAHHVGMSIAACANAVLDNVMCRRFMRNAQMACAQSLLEEKIPTDAVILRDRVTDAREIKPAASDGIKSSGCDIASPHMALLSGFRTSLCAADTGEIWLQRKSDRHNRHITLPPDRQTFRNVGFCAASSVGGRLFSPCVRLCGDVSRSFEYDRDRVKYSLTADSRLVTFTHRLSPHCCAMYTDVEAVCREGDKVQHMLYLRPVLDRLCDYNAHPAFASLSVEAMYDSENRIVIFRRRSRKAGEELYLAVGLSDKSRDFTFETRADKLFGERSDLLGIMTDRQPLSCSVGACIDPRLFISTRGEKRRDRLSFILLCATTYENAVKGFLRAREECFSRICAEEMSRMSTKRALETCTQRMTEGEKLLLERLLRGVMYEKTACEGKPHCRYTLNDLWQYGISGDVPIVSMKVRDSEALTDCTAVIKLHRLCVLCGVHFDLVFLIRETELYGCPLENGLGALIKRFGSGYLVGKKGGIFLLSADKGDIIDSVSRLCVNDALPQSEPLLPLSVCTLPDKSCHSDTPPSVLSTHGGDFTAMGFTVDKVDRCPPLAYSHVLSNLAFGSVITHNSLGYSWFSNSHERRLTRFENNAYDSFVSEKVYIAREGVLYDLCAMATSVQYLPNLAIYRGRAADTDYTLEVTLHARLFIKLVRVTLSHRQRVIYAAVPHFTRALHLERTEDGIIFRSPFATEGGIITSRGGKPAFSLYEAMGHSCTLRDTAAVYCEGESMSFALCAVTERSLEYTKNAALNADFDKIYAETRKFTLEMLGKDVRDSHVGEDGISVMRNFWLPYQAIFCRFFARGALYQSGGAYGLRDQLQDCRIFFGDNPRFARRHIIRCAAHQFEEGDAQHWWHNIRRHDGFNAGIRSRCSDDYLWLVWVCCEYAEVTGDEGIWDVQVRYLSDAPLERSEHERYSVPAFSEVKESIFHHCLRAVRLFEARGVGAHGLALMGSCDWNDGMSAVGIGGKGESVWLSLFARIVLEMFGEVCKKRGEPYKEWLTLSDRLGESIDRSAWNGKWFMRGFYDDGSPLGDDSRDECKIDILPQAFSAMADAFLAKKRPDAYRSDRERITSALDYAYKMLYDRENRILKLFTPPFDKSLQNPGYIKSYAAGLRENGGQYTHGAVWGAMGFAAAGQQERAREITEALCPALRAQDRRLFEKYKTEPYVLCGDVYANPQHLARGGWSWYTGSAAWYTELVDNVDG